MSKSRGVMIRTSTVVTALRAEMRIQQRLAEVESSGALRERALGALSSLEELMLSLGLRDDVHQTEYHS